MPKFDQDKILRGCGEGGRGGARGKAERFHQHKHYHPLGAGGKFPPPFGAGEKFPLSLPCRASGAILTVYTLHHLAFPLPRQRRDFLNSGAKAKARALIKRLKAGIGAEGKGKGQAKGFIKKP